LVIQHTENLQTYSFPDSFSLNLPKNDEMRKEERFDGVIAWFQQNRPEAETELEYADPYQLTVAVILSAQCTDKRVNLITPAFFKRFPAFSQLASARSDEVYEFVKSCSYPNNKAKNLIGMAQKVMDEFQGELPPDVDLLQTIPGIGRKTANVLASSLFNIPAIAVDTHVFRVAARIGLTTNAKNPLQAERQLVGLIPENLLSIAHHWLLLHGRYICLARKPQCPECGLKPFCKYYQSLKQS
jgi:endonuclease-3